MLGLGFAAPGEEIAFLGCATFSSNKLGTETSHPPKIYPRPRTAAISSADDPQKRPDLIECDEAVAACLDHLEDARPGEFL